MDALAVEAGPIGGRPARRILFTAGGGMVSPLLDELLRLFA